VKYTTALKKSIWIGIMVGLFLLGFELSGTAASSGMFGTAIQKLFGVQNAEASSLFQSCITQIELPVVYKCEFRRMDEKGVVCAEKVQRRWFDCPNCWATKKGMVDCDYYSNPPCKSVPLPAQPVSCMAANNKNPTPTRRPRQINPTATPVPPLPAPSANIACDPSGTQATISWGALSGAERYVVRVNKEPFSDWANSAGGDVYVETRSTSYTVNIEAGANYTYSVQGVRAGDPYPYPGQWSAWNRFTCSPPDTGVHTGANGTVGMSDCSAYGWARRADRPNESVSVQVRIGSQVINGQTRGNNSTFNIDLSAYVEPGEQNTVSVYAEGRNGWFLLDGTPKRLTCIAEPELSIKTPPADIVYFWNSRDLDPNTKLPEFEVQIENFYGGKMTIDLYSPYGYDPDGDHDHPDKKGHFYTYTVEADSNLFNINGTSATFKMNAESADKLEKPKKVSRCIANPNQFCFGTTLGKDLRGTDRNKPSDAIGWWTAVAQYENEYGEKSDKVLVFWKVEGTIVGER